MNTDVAREKVRQAVGILKEREIDCWITFVRESAMSGEPCLELMLGSSVTWLSAFIISRKAGSYAIVGRGDVQAVEKAGSFDRVIGYTEGIKKPLLDTLTAINPDQIALNYSLDNTAADGLSHGMYLKLKELLRGTGLEERYISADPLVTALRGRKTPSEVKAVKEAVRMTETILGELPGYIKPGMSEREIFDRVKERMKYYNVEPSWDALYDPGIICGPDSPTGHCLPEEDVFLEKGQTLVLDFGLKVNGYSSDLQRTWYVLRDGEKAAPQLVRDAFNDLLEIVEAGEKVIRPGVKGYEVDREMREAIREKGYPEWEYAMGHEIGRSAHDGSICLGPEWERYGESVRIPLEVNNCFAVECGIKLPGVGSFNFEQNIIITPDGFDYLSSKQKELYYLKNS